MPRIFTFTVVFLIFLHSTTGKTLELTKTTSFNITPYISYNNFIAHGEVYADYTKKKVKYIPSITVGLGLNFYEALSKNVSFLHGLDFGYNIYSKKQTNIINTITKNTNENRAIDTIKDNGGETIKMQNIAEIHDKIEQERQEIIETNKAIVNDLYFAVWKTYLGDVLPEEEWHTGDYIHESSVGFDLIESLNYSKLTTEEIANLIEDTLGDDTFVIPLMDKDYDEYVSWNEAYNVYINGEGELLWLDKKHITEENATKYAMLKTGLLQKPENYDEDPYTKYNNISSVKQNNVIGENNKNIILKTTYSFVERYYIMYRIGFNVKQTQNISLQPFLGLGLNIGELNITKLYSTNITSTSKKFKAGFSMGLGLDMIVKERFVVGLNYRLSINKYNNIAKFYTHCFAFKFGFAFL